MIIMIIIIIIINNKIRTTIVIYIYIYLHTCTCIKIGYIIYICCCSENVRFIANHFQSEFSNPKRDMILGWYSMD